MYRGGSGVTRDSEYGYSKDFVCPPIGQFKLNSPTNQPPKRDSDVTDANVLRKQFKVTVLNYQTIIL